MGFAPGLLLVFPPVLLVHPPNSSSAATLGVGANPPEAPGIILWLAKEPPVLPQGPKSLPLGKTGDLIGDGLFIAGAGTGVGSGLPHALPQTSELLNADVFRDDAVLVVGPDIGTGFG